MTTTRDKGEYRGLTPLEIGKTVTTLRNWAGLKQFTLAHEAGVAERTVQRLERGDKVNEESLRRVAKALRMDENSFIGPRRTLGDEERSEKAKKQLEDMLVINAHRFVTIKDAEAVLGINGMVIDDHCVTDEAATKAASFKDSLQDWNDAYSVLVSNQEKLAACQSLLNEARELEACGYVIHYGTYKTEDGFHLASMLFARKDDALREVKQLVVPSRFTEMA